MTRIDELQKMLTDFGDDCFLLHALGLEWVNRQEWQNARNCFEKVLCLDEQYLGTYYHFGKLWEQLNNKTKAVEVYEKGIMIANTQNNRHALSELQQALDECFE